MPSDFLSKYNAQGINNIKEVVQENLQQKIRTYETLKILTQTRALKDIIKDYGRDKSIEIIRRGYKEDLKSALEIMEVLKIFQPRIDRASLSWPFSFFLQLRFILEKPYFSKDDDEFYPIDNPVRKDKVFKVPMVSPSTWKGNLRQAVRLEFEMNDDDLKMIRLFGNSKAEETNFQQGRLFFFPTFFADISLEVINPHSRETRTGTEKGPVHLECVRNNNTEGTFSLLYVPFDLIGRFEVEPGKTKCQPLEDSKITLKAVNAMLLKHGFSAKKTSCYGIVKKISGKLLLAGIEEEIKIPLTGDFEGVSKKVESIWGNNGREN